MSTMPNENNLRQNTLETLQSYVSETLDHIDSVTDFCNRNSKWVLQRETELDLMRDIQERVKLLNVGIGHVFSATDKGKAIGEFFGSKWCSGSKRKVVETELATVLKNTLKGVEELTYFLDAVEKLASTSLHVFTGGDEVLKLSLHGISLQSVADSISVARLVCPLLLLFKRDAGAFFFPSLHNVDVIVAELDKYIRTAEKICTRMEKSSTTGFRHKEVKQPLVQLAELITEDAMGSIISHVNQLSDIRMDPHFRLVYLFQEKSVSGFMDKFSEHHPRMLQVLKNIEDSAIQLDDMKLGSNISKVAGNSLGIIGVVLTAVGVALAPLTAGLSLGLTVGGAGLGITSSVNTVVTRMTEITVNTVQQKKSKEGLQGFLQDMKSIQECLDEVANQREETFGINYADIFTVIDAIKTFSDEIDGFVQDLVPDVGQELIPEILTNVLENLPILESLGMDMFTICKDIISLAKGGKSEVDGFVQDLVPDVGQELIPEILTNVLENLPILESLGMDMFTICKDIISLAKGGKSEVSKFLRDRAKCLATDLETWQQMHESLKQGMLESERGQSILNRSFLYLSSKNMESGVQLDPMEVKANWPMKKFEEQ